VKPATAGLRIHRREIAGPAAWQAILDRPTWEELRAALADPARRKKRSGGPYILSGLVFSPSGHRMNGVLRRGMRLYSSSSGTHRRPDDEVVIHTQISADALEEVIVGAVLARADGAVLPDLDDDAETVAVETIEAELADLARLRGEGTISMAEWLAVREPLTRRRDSARAAVPGFSRHSPRTLRADWTGLDVDRRRAELRVFVERIEIKSAGRSRHVPLAERIAISWRI
jgi:hypothetical protein